MWFRRISQIEKQRLTIDEFIEKSNIIHNNYYGYEKVVYLNNSTKVIISCSKHGNFKQRPHDHLQGKGCNACGRLRTSEKQRKSQNQFLISSGYHFFGPKSYNFKSSFIIFLHSFSTRIFGYSFSRSVLKIFTVTHFLGPFLYY